MYWKTKFHVKIILSIKISLLHKKYIAVPTTNNFLELYQLTTPNIHDKEIQKEKGVNETILIWEEMGVFAIFPST